MEKPLWASSMHTHTHRVNQFSATCKAALLSQLESRQNRNDDDTWWCHRAITAFGPVFHKSCCAVLDSWETLFLQTSVLDTQVTVSTRVYYVHSIRLTSVSGCEFCGTSSFQHCSTAFKTRRFEAVTSCASFPPALLGFAKQPKYVDEAIPCNVRLYLNILVNSIYIYTVHT